MSQTIHQVLMIKIKFTTRNFFVRVKAKFSSLFSTNESPIIATTTRKEEDEGKKGQKNGGTRTGESVDPATSRNMSNKRGPAEPPSFLQEVAFLAVSALFSCLVLSFFG